jgi:hypothetical protein
MDFNTTVDLIIRELNEAVEIIEDLKNYQNVPFLQVELAKSKCRNAADVIRLLKNLQVNSPSLKGASENQISAGKQVSEKTVTELKKPEKIERKPEIPPQETRKMKEEPPLVSKKTAETVTLGDTFGQRSDSLNEKLGIRKDDDDISDILKSKPITRLSEAIGINDKFLFIRELFNGNSELYNKTISRLDSSGTFTDARAIVMNFAGNDAENQAAKQLLELVKRKFPAYE